MKRILDKAKVKEWIPGIIVTLAISFLLFLYAPLEMFFANQVDLWFDMYHVLGVVIYIFLLAFVAGSLFLIILWFINKKAYYVGMLCYFIAYICTYVQGNFLVAGLPQLDGSSINWNLYTTGRIKTIILWCVVILLVSVIAKKFTKEKVCNMVVAVSAFITLMLLMTIVTVCITTKGYVPRNKLLTTEEIFEMSQDKNYIIFMLDSVDTVKFKELIEENSEYRAVFEDFTYYPDMVGSYQSTAYALTYMLSGEWYEEQEPFEDYKQDVYNDSYLFEMMEESGYQCNAYETEVPLTNSMMSRFDNIKVAAKEISSYWHFAKGMIKLAGYRYMPFDLKKYCVFDIYQFYHYIQPMEEYVEFTSTNSLFIELMEEEPIEYVDEKCFKLIHIDGAHPPFEMNKDLERDQDAEYEDEVEASIGIVKRYLDKLKESGVYDNSVIIILADHGYNWSNPSEPDEGRHMPLFCAKGFFETHDLVINNAPVSHADLPEAFCRLNDGYMSGDIFDWKEGDIRERRFLLYRAYKAFHLYEFIQTGNAADMSTMQPSGVEYILEE